MSKKLTFIELNHWTRVSSIMSDIPGLARSLLIRQSWKRGGSEILASQRAFSSSWCNLCKQSKMINGNTATQKWFIFHLAKVLSPQHWIACHTEGTSLHWCPPISSIPLPKCPLAAAACQHPKNQPNHLPLPQLNPGYRVWLTGNKSTMLMSATVDVWSPLSAAPQYQSTTPSHVLSRFFYHPLPRLYYFQFHSKTIRVIDKVSLKFPSISHKLFCASLHSLKAFFLSSEDKPHTHLLDLIT